MKTLIDNLKIFIVLIVITGVVYPLFITLCSQGLFSEQANGSLVVKNGKISGSKLIAQEFKGEKYFWPRPSAANYDPTASSGSNLSPDNKALHEMIAKRATDNHLSIESNDDLLYASGSGLDPHISPESAERQVNRIAMARHMDENTLKKLIAENTENRQFGILGKARVNVLKLNLLLDEKF